jgi:hypothetical protein
MYSYKNSNEIGHIVIKKYRKITTLINKQRAGTVEFNNWAEINCIMKKMLMGLPFGIVVILTIIMTAPMTANAGEPPTAKRCYDAGLSRWLE